MRYGGERGGKPAKAPEAVSWPSVKCCAVRMGVVVGMFSYWFRNQGRRRRGGALCSRKIHGNDKKKVEREGRFRPRLRECA